MKPLYQRVAPRVVDEGFVVKSLQAGGFDCPWHAHPEYELILVLESNGYRVVGDNIADITPGDLVLLGPDLPHIWQNDPNGAGPHTVHAILLQFDQRVLADGLLRLPAFGPVRRLLERAGRGLHFTGRTQALVADRMQQMLALDPYQQFLHLLEILGILAESEEAQSLATAGLAPNAVEHDQDRMNRVFTFIRANLDQCLRLKDVAKVVALSESAFSRFFRGHAGRTFPGFVNELRVGRACRLLTETDKSIAEISYQCGFSNLSNFNRQFLRTKRQNPTVFRREMLRRL